jgi:hypothetical protein
MLENIRSSGIFNYREAMEIIFFLLFLPRGMRSLFLWGQQKKNNIFSLRLCVSNP